MDTKKAKILDAIVVVVFILGLLAALLDLFLSTYIIIEKYILISIPLIIAAIFTPIFYNALTEIEVKSHPDGYEGYDLNSTLANSARTSNIAMLFMQFFLHTFSSGTLILLLLLSANYFGAGPVETIRSEYNRTEGNKVFFKLEGSEYSTYTEDKITINEPYCDLKVRKGLLGYYVLKD